MDYSTKSIAMKERMTALQNKTDLNEAERKELEDLVELYPRQRKIDDVRLFIDYMETHPAIPMPYISEFTVYCNQYDDDYKDNEGKTKEYMRQVVRELKRTFGMVKKDHSDSSFAWVVTFGESLRVKFSCSRKNVCVPKVVGVREIAAMVVPARTEDIIEWDCTDSVLAD